MYIDLPVTKTQLSVSPQFCTL